MNYVKLKNGSVVETRSEFKEGFIEAPDNAECGDLFDGTNWTLGNVRRITAIKAKAGEIIEARFPLTAQLNMLARYAELCGRYVILPLTAEAKEKAALEASYDWIKAVREESNRLEADPNATPNWPPYE